MFPPPKKKNKKLQDFNIIYSDKYTFKFVFTMLAPSVILVKDKFKENYIHICQLIFLK